MIGEFVVKVSVMPVAPRCAEASATFMPYAGPGQACSVSSNEKGRPERRPFRQRVTGGQSRPRAVALRRGPPAERGSWSRQRMTAVDGQTQDHLLSVVATKDG